MPTQLELEFIPHEIGTALIHQRAIDGYVNATAMCRAASKLFGHYRENETTQAFLKELSSVIGIPITGLVVTIQGGTPALQGTWVHPDVAVNLGQWCSPKFAVAVSQWVREWMAGTARPVGMPYHIQRYLANRSEIPVTHFSILNEMVFGLIAPLEAVGYTLPEDMIPDISEGKMFCGWLRDVKGLDPSKFLTYKHRYADGRVVNAKLYPNELLAEFRTHFHTVWLPKRAAAYFAERDAKALEYLPKALPAPKKSTTE